MKPGVHVLDVGSGSGYLTACFWRYIKAQGEHDNTRIVGIEHQAELVTLSKQNLNNDDESMLKSGNLIILGKSYISLCFDMWCAIYSLSVNFN